MKQKYKQWEFLNRRCIGYFSASCRFLQNQSIQDKPGVGLKLAKLSEVNEKIVPGSTAKWQVKTLP